jgi:hypothetical protein
MSFRNIQERRLMCSVGVKPTEVGVGKKQQWSRILANAPLIEAFIGENEGKLKTKE